jgi:hypothetical protein
MMLSQDSLEMDEIGSKKGISMPAPYSSMLGTFVDLPLETRSRGVEVRAISIVLEPHVDHYPDGGPAAWSVVFGVSPLAISCRPDSTHSVH